MRNYLFCSLISAILFASNVCAESTGTGGGTSTGSTGTSASTGQSGTTVTSDAAHDTSTRGSLRKNMPGDSNRDEIGNKGRSAGGSGSNPTQSSDTGSARTNPDPSGVGSSGSQNSLGSGGMAGSVNR